MVGWSSSVIDVLVDMNPPSAKANLTFFRVPNLNDAEAWLPLLQHVEAHGKFDFAISNP